MSSIIIVTALICFQAAAPPPPPPAPTPKPESVVVISQEHPEVTEARAVRQALEKFIANKENKIKSYSSKTDRFRLLSDYKSSAVPKKAMKACEDLLATFDWAMGSYQAQKKTRWIREDYPFDVVMIQKEEVFHNLIDEIIAVAPERLHAYLEANKRGTGFTLYPGKLTINYNDVKIQAEARLDRSMAHSVAHLEMHRRYSYQPLWLAEGIACAMEELAFGEIWANWYRDGFVAAVSHSGWRGAPTKNMINKLPLTALWSYPAKPYQDNLAHLSYGFAVFALESQPMFLHKLALGIQAKYDEYPEQGAQFILPPTVAANIANQVFDGDLQQALRDYWAKVPRAPNVKKARKVDLGRSPE
jgi:hypothetical protein